MLYKNGEKISMNQPRLKELKDLFPFPVVIKMPDSAKRYDKANKKDVFPASHFIPYSGQYSDKTGTNDYRYASTIRRGKGGETLFEPTGYFLKDKLTLSDPNRDMELLYFLYFYSEYCENGKNFKGGKGLCIIEDVKGESKTVFDDRQLQIKTQTLLFDSDNMLPDEKVADIARSFFMANVGDKDPYTLRLELESVIKNTKDGFKEFVEMADVKSDMVEIKSIIQQAIDENLIGFNPAVNSWCFIAENKQFSSRICPAEAGKNKNESLYEYLTRNSELIETLNNSVFKDETVEEE